MTPPLPLLPPLAFLPEYPTVLETLGYQAVGLIVVFTALGLIWILLEGMGAWFRRAAARSAKPASSPIEPAGAHLATPPSQAASSPTPPADDPLVPFVIAAAVHTVLAGRLHRIVSITPATDHQSWSAEGRRQIFSSHKVR